MSKSKKQEPEKEEEKPSPYYQVPFPSGDPEFDKAVREALRSGKAIIVKTPRKVT